MMVVMQQAGRVKLPESSCGLESHEKQRRSRLAGTIEGRGNRSRGVLRSMDDERVISVT